MAMSLNDTPRAMRLHIGLFGRRNSGKSSLINALTGQHVATVSDVPGTTTDPVYKSMEIHGIGPVVFIDTAGFDDSGSLGALRVERTRDAAKETDIALVLFTASRDDGAGEAGNEAAFRWLEQLKRRGVPAISVISRIDESTAAASLAQVIEARTGERPVLVSAATGEGLAALRAEIARHLPEDYRARSITAEVCESGDAVLLVMPQYWDSSSCANCSTASASSRAARRTACPRCSPRWQRHRTLSSRTRRHSARCMRNCLPTAA